jgi:glutamate synthase (NADPH/NADH) small chain
MGVLGPEQPLVKDLKVETDPRSNIKAEHGKYTTSIPGIFAAGDCRRGQSLIVWAINEGRGAARECDRFLMGSTDLP